MLQNLFLTIVFFTLSHFLILVVLSLIGLIAMRYFYVIWNDELGAPHVRQISLLVLIILVIMLIIFITVVIYVISIFIIYLPELRKLNGI